MGYGSGFLTKNRHMNFKCLHEMVGNTCAIQTRECDNVYNDVRCYSVWFRFVPISKSTFRYEYKVSQFQESLQQSSKNLANLPVLPSN
jgi:hypothetical protein